jgi:hypothetical protein
MGYTGNNHHAQKYDAKKAYDKDLSASARLHYLENSEHDKHAARMYGDPAAKMHGSMKGDQSDQHIDYKNYKGTDKGYHGSTGSSHGDQSNIFHDYEKHPSKMYGDPAAKNITKVLSEGARHNAAPKMYDDAAPKFNAGLRAASAAGKLSGKFEDAVNAAPKMDADLSDIPLQKDLLSNRMGGYAGDASGAPDPTRPNTSNDPAPMMEALGKPALMMKKGIASMCGMKK